MPAPMTGFFPPSTSRDEMISLSRNEIRAECEKALRGTGLPWGIARDGGMMASWLGGMGLPFLGGINRAVETIAQDQGSGRDPVSVVSVPLVAPAFGLVMAEQVAATGTSWTGRVLAPRFLLAGAAILAQEQGVRLAMLSGGKLKVIADAGQVAAEADGWQDGEYTLECLNEGKDLPQGARHHLTLLAAFPDKPALVPEACWQRLGTYAKETYVPETEEKRARGAGAGNIDNS